MFVRNTAGFTRGVNASLREAMVAIQSSGAAACCIVIREGVFHDVITDGDLRRALLSGLSLDVTISQVLQLKTREPLTMRDGVVESAVLAFMKRHHLRQLPILDSQKRVISVAVLLDGIDTRLENTCAVIMAGGRGSRLGDLTTRCPKPMLPLGGKPMLEHIICDLADHGIERFLVSVNYLASKITDYFGDGSRFGVSIDYLREIEPLGTAGSLALIPKSITDDFIVTNGDVLTSVDYAALRCSHIKSRASVTVCSTSYQVEIPFGVLDLSGRGVQAIHEKPTLQYQVSAGIYFISNKIIGGLSTVRRFDMPELISSALASGYGVECFPIIETWADIGTPIEYERAVRQNS
jgi:dTDP-glucose pyrophosphorylase